MRITILGLPGSGKSTLASRIAKMQNIPHIHIDHFWREGGGGHNSRTTPNIEQTREYVKAKVLESVNSESWVSDGVYSLVQPEIAKRADTMIFLDIPLWRRLLNHAKRTVASFRGKGEMGLRSNVEFFREMISPDLNNREKIDNLLKVFGGRKVILRSRFDMDKYLLSLASAIQ